MVGEFMNLIWFLYRYHAAMVAKYEYFSVLWNLICYCVAILQL